MQCGNDQPDEPDEGAAMPSKNLMMSIPRQITRILSAKNDQNHAKTTLCHPLNDHNIDNIQITGCRATSVVGRGRSGAGQFFKRGGIDKKPTPVECVGR
jgi:hypothetical protein